MELFEDPIWQMSYGERAAVEGVLHWLKPSLAIEIGSAEGACLRRIAQYSAEVHSFDLVAPTIENLPDHVQLHGGDSHQLLPEVLACFAEAGRNVDFVMVDGDHSAEGVRRDIEDLLRSPAIANTIILAHDIANELVRAGLDAVPYGAYPKVAHADLDFVPGYMGQDRFTGELWGGLALIIVDASRGGYGSEPALQTVRHHGGEMLAIARDVIAKRPPDSDVRGYDPRARMLADARAHVIEQEQRIAELEQTSP